MVAGSSKNSDVERSLGQFELHFNEQRADLTVFRVALQLLMLRIAGRQQDRAEEIIDTMKRETLAALQRMPIAQDQQQGSQRAKELAIMRGELFFQDLEDTVSQVRNKLGQSGAN